MNQVDQFEKEKQSFQNSIAFVQSNVTDEAEKKKQLETIQKSYLQTLKMYLAPAIQTLNEIFSCQYKTSKIQNGYDANFNKIETSIPKTKEELLADMKFFQSKLNTLDPEKQKSASLSIEIISAINELDLNATTEVQPQIEFVERVEPKIIPQKPNFDEQPVQVQVEQPKKKRNPIGTFFFVIFFAILLVIAGFIVYYFIYGKFPIDLPFDFPVRKS